MTSYTKKIFLPCHILGLLGLPLLLNSYELLFYTIGYFVLTAQAGFEIGYHRMMTHKSFETTKFWEKLLLFLGTMSGVGQPLFFGINAQETPSVFGYHKRPSQPYKWSNQVKFVQHLLGQN